MSEDLLSLKDLARMWGRSPRTVGRWLRHCRATVYRPSKRTLMITRTEAERVFKSMECRYEF